MPFAVKEYPIVAPCGLQFQRFVRRRDAGKIADFPATSVPYEDPENANFVLGTHEFDFDDGVKRIVELLKKRGVLN